MKKLFLGLLLTALVVVIPVVAASNGSDIVTISKDNVLVLNGVVNEDSVSAIMQQATKLDKNYALIDRLRGKQPLYLFLNTPGGSIQAGLELIEYLKGLGRPVHTITSFAASMGFQLVQNLDDRLILSSGVLMSHHAKGSFEGEFGGKPTQLDSRYHFWLQRLNEMDVKTVQRTNGKQTYESYVSAYDHELWMTAPTSIAGGFADRVVLLRCDDSLSGVTEHDADFLGIKFTYDQSDCPLNSAPSNVRVAGGVSNLTPDYIEFVKHKFISSKDVKLQEPIMTLN